MADLVSEIISQGALDQLELANAQLELAVKNVNNVASAAKGIVIDFKGAANIGELNAAMAKQAELITKVTDATDKLEKASYRKQVAIDKAERDELLGIQRVIDAKERQRIAAEKLRFAQERYGENYIAQLNKQENAERKLRAAQERYGNAYVAQLEKERIAAEKLRQAQERFGEQYIAELQKNAELKKKNDEREAKALAKLNNAYEQLKVQYKQAADEAKRLGAEFGVTDARAQAAAGSAMKLYNSLLAVEKSVGQAQRQVGQYNQAAFAMSQLLREMPAFTYSLATGFMAISNNIPILVDEINKLKASNEALKASGGTTIPIWKTLMSAITSPVGLITIATTVITVLAAKTDIFKSSVDEAAKSVEALSQKLQDIRQDMMDAFSIENTDINTLVSILEDTNNLLELRIKALKELQKLKPQYFGDITEEEALKGVQKDKLDMLKQQILVEKEMEATSQRIKALSEERVKLEKIKAEESQKGENILWYLGLGQNKAQDIGDINLKIREVTENIEAAQKALASFRKISLTFPTPPEKEKKVKEKAVKDTTLKSESDLLRAEYELNKQRTEQDAAAQKEIADNEKNSLNQRLDAYMEYQSALFQLAILERDYIVKQEQLKRDEITEKLKTAKGKEIENLNEQLMASNVRVKTATEKTAGEFIGIEKKTAEGRLAIIGSANDKFIDAQKELLTKLTTNETFAYLNEIEALKDALEKKEMTRREYNKRLAELQKKQQISFLQAEIEFDQKILSNQSLTPEKRKQYEEKLQKDLQAKSRLEKGVAKPQRQGFRITDSIAMLFDHDLENEEQYLQEFYDRTVDLANQAANAIIEANNRKYEEENRRLDEQSRKIEANYLEQSRLIDATVKDETERYNQQQKLLAQTEAQQATIEDRKREVARRQAQAQKAASIAAIIQNTAVAITKAIAQFTVGAAPIVALIAASGAVQLAAASNTPIPAYKEGTTYHKGGKFIAGDGGEKELIIAPNKKPYWSNSISTLYDEAEGTKVIPKSAMQYAMANTTSNVGNLSAAYDARNSSIIAETIGSIVSREFDKTGRKLATVIVNSQPKQQQTESVADELRKMRNLQGI
jgi:hypothetical protein